MTTNQIAYQKAIAEADLNKQRARETQIKNKLLDLETASKMYTRFGVDMEPTIRKYGGHYGAAWLNSMSDLANDQMTKFWSNITPASSLVKK